MMTVFFKILFYNLKPTEYDKCRADEKLIREFSLKKN